MRCARKPLCQAPAAGQVPATALAVRASRGGHGSKKDASPLDRREQAARIDGKSQKGKKKNRSIEDSQVVPYLSTNSTITDLTSQIGRDAVLSSVYGRG